MDFEFFNGQLHKENPGYVQVKKKYANFTVRIIGGEAEMAKERLIMQAKEAIYQLKLGKREDSIAAFEKELGQPVSHPTVHTSSWNEKLAFAKTERKRLAKREQAVIDTPPWVDEPEPKKSIFKKIKEFFLNTINNMGAH